MANRNVPIILVSGFLGAGKTTFCQSICTKLSHRRIVSIHDDGLSDVTSMINEAVEMSAADCILVECAASLEPFLVAEHLTYGDEETLPPQNAKIDALVTVIDSANFFKDVFESSSLKSIDLALGEEDSRKVSDVLIEQVEFANVILLNKTDLVSHEDLARLEALMARLNPEARILLSVQGDIEPYEIVDSNRFSFEETEDGVGWLAELEGEFSDVGSCHGVMSFTYKVRRPFHPLRFHELISDWTIEGLVRARGSVWVASRHHEIGVWSIAGRSSEVSYGGYWFASTPARDWPIDERERAAIMAEWTAPFGDRRQEIAFIGIDLNESEIRRRLDECLLKHEEMKEGPEAWTQMPDPLPDWHHDADLEF